MSGVSLTLGPRDPILERRMIRRKSEEELERSAVSKKEESAGKKPSSPRKDKESKKESPVKVEEKQ